MEGWIGGGKGGRGWGYLFSVVVVLTASHPGGADKNVGARETHRGADHIPGPGIRAFLGGYVVGHRGPLLIAISMAG